MWEIVGKMRKSGNSGKKLGKVGGKLEKSGKSWEKVAKVARCGYMWFYVAKSGFMWLKVVYVVQSMYYLKDNT